MKQKIYEIFNGDFNALKDNIYYRRNIEVTFKLSFKLLFIMSFLIINIFMVKLHK